MRREKTQLITPMLLETRYNNNNITNDCKLWIHTMRHSDFVRKSIIHLIYYITCELRSIKISLHFHERLCHICSSLSLNGSVRFLRWFLKQSSWNICRDLAETLKGIKTARFDVISYSTECFRFWCYGMQFSLV